MRTQSKTGNLLKAREKASDQMGMALVLYLIGWDGGARFLDQSQSVAKKNQSNPYSTLPCITDGVAPSLFFSSPSPSPPFPQGLGWEGDAMFLDQSRSK